jgi:hypothetical protein
MRRSADAALSPVMRRLWGFSGCKQNWNASVPLVPWRLEIFADLKDRLVRKAHQDQPAHPPRHRQSGCG